MMGNVKVAFKIYHLHLSLFSNSKKTTSLSNGVFLIQHAEVGKKFLNQWRSTELSNPHTNHNEIILSIGLKLLVKPECLRLDSAQHGPRAKEETKVSCGQAPSENTHSASPTHPVRPWAGVIAASGFHSGWGRSKPRGLDAWPTSPQPPRPRGSSLLAPRPLTTGGAGWLSPACSKIGSFSEAGIWSSSRPNPPAPRLPSWYWVRISVAVSIETRRPAVVGAGRNGTGRGYASTRPLEPKDLPHLRAGQGLLEKEIGVGSPGYWYHRSYLVPARPLLHPWPGSYGN